MKNSIVFLWPIFQGKNSIRKPNVESLENHPEISIKKNQFVIDLGT